MSLPAYKITVTAFDQDDNSIAGAIFTAQLNRDDVNPDYGYVAKERLEYIADANSQAVMSL